MKTVTQVAVFGENRPGTLQTIAEGLTSLDVNVLGISVTGAADHAVIRLVVDDDHAAAQAFSLNGIDAIFSEIFELQMPLDGKFGLAEISQDLSDAGVNIQYVYGSPIPGGTLFMRVSDPAKGLTVLEGMGL